MALEHNYFAEARDAMRRYQTTIHDILSGYNRSIEAAKAESARYKDEAGFVEQKRSELVPAARSRIEAADRQLQTEICNGMSELRKKIHDYASKPAPRGFMDSLKDILDFNVKLSTAELEALARRSEGNYLALRALQTVAKQSGYPSVDDMEKGINDLEKRVKPPIHYCDLRDHGDVAAALDCFSNSVQRNQNGDALFTTQRPTTLSITLSSANIRGMDNALTQLETAWQTKSATIDKFEATVDDDGKKVTAEEQRRRAIDEAVEGLDFTSDAEPGAELANVIAAQRAEEAQITHDVLTYYTQGRLNGRNRTTERGTDHS